MNQECSIFCRSRYIARGGFTASSNWYWITKVLVCPLEMVIDPLGMMIFIRQSSLREIMNIPDNYKVLFLQGGAHLQFSMIPLNLKKNGKADYLVTGNWAKKSYQEGKKYLTANIVASSEDKKYTYIPKISKADLSGDADFLHITTNNTVFGTRIRDKDIVCLDNVPLVADMSSNILSEVYDVSKFGIIYAGAQKNMGPAGVTVVIIREI